MTKHMKMRAEHDKEAQGRGRLLALQAAPEGCCLRVAGPPGVLLVMKHPLALIFAFCM